MAKKLVDFLIALSLDANLRRQYEQQGSAAAQQFGLSKKDAALLAAGDGKKIKAALSASAKPGKTVHAPSKPSDTVRAPAKPAETVRAPRKPAETVRAPGKPAETVRAPRKPAEPVRAPAKPSTSKAKAKKRQ